MRSYLVCLLVLLIASGVSSDPRADIERAEKEMRLIPAALLLGNHQASVELLGLNRSGNFASRIQPLPAL